MTFIRRIWTTNALAVLAAYVGLGAVSAQEFQLGLPVDCTLGKECFVQNYVDLDAGEGVLDAACGSATYNGHKGTDFRTLNTLETADVLAAAPGIVRGIRNDMPDMLISAKEDRAKIKGRECGNGVVIAHPDGWETQYCHLRKGSVMVKPGQKVDRGQKLGQIGYSGFAAFAHVHLSVRKGGATIDPFLGIGPHGAAITACSADRLALAGKALWQDDAEALLSDASGVLIELGFSDGPVTSGDLEAGQTGALTASSSALVFYARAINLKKGDQLTLEVHGPDGVLAASEGEPLLRQKAQWVAFAGRKLRAERWPAGSYRGEAKLVRGGAVLQSNSATIVLE